MNRSSLIALLIFGLLSVLVKLDATGSGDPDAGWFLADACDRSFCDKGVQRIRQGPVREPGQRCSLQILERNPRPRRAANQALRESPKL